MRKSTLGVLFSICNSYYRSFSPFSVLSERSMTLDNDSISFEDSLELIGFIAVQWRIDQGVYCAI